MCVCGCIDWSSSSRIVGEAPSCAFAKLQRCHRVQASQQIKLKEPMRSAITRGPLAQEEGETCILFSKVACDTKRGRSGGSLCVTAGQPPNTQPAGHATCVPTDFDCNGVAVRQSVAGWPLQLAHLRQELAQLKHLPRAWQQRRVVHRARLKHRAALHRQAGRQTGHGDQAVVQPLP
jgi:hypothetical protein